MNEEFLVVWRAVEGAALQTYANPDKSLRVFADAGAPEAREASWVELDELTALLEQRDPFEPVLVGKTHARNLLGWSV